MKTRSLGTTGVEVGEIGLGGMWLSIYDRPPIEHGVRVVHAALDRGVTLIDTADVYCRDQDDIGHNERVVARAVREWPGRSEVLVATKGGLERPGGEWTRNGRPDHLRAACEASLTALGVETIDLYQLHAPDPEVPLAESVGALSRLREDGKIRHVGLSNVSVDEIEVARAIVPIASVQNRCSVLHRVSWDDGVVPHCEAHDIAFLPYSPVGGGHGKGEVGRHPVLGAVGARHGVTPYQVALAWLLARSPVMIPIPGARRIESAVDSAETSHAVSLTADDLAELAHHFPT